jgi:hypothetical protein
MRVARATLLALCALAPTGARAEAPSHLLVTDNVRLRISSYLDAGFFATEGDGVAYVRDVGKLRHPNATGSWVFDGDPWSNTINAQGDSADLGLDRSNIPRFDPIHSHGRPSFIVNDVNLTLAASVGDDLLMETSLNFMPRQGVLGSTGDLLNIDLAYLDWTPLPGWDLHLFAGTFESTFGIEYRRRKAPDGWGVTPSIVSRYTVGTPTGLKARGTFADGLFTLNVAVTNGSMSTEKFGVLSNELSTTVGKTLSGRASVAPPLPGLDAFEVGASVLYGPQDLQSSDRVRLFQWGVDLQARWEDLELRAEYLQVRAPGGGVDAAMFLHADGWYVDALAQVLPTLALHGRLDSRKANLLEEPNQYFTDTVRGTLGIRCDFTFNIIAKAEVTLIAERPPGPPIADNVATSSLVLKF